MNSGSKGDPLITLKPGFWGWGSQANSHSLGRWAYSHNRTVFLGKWGLNSLGSPKNRTHFRRQVFSQVERELRPSETFSGRFSLAWKLPEVFLGGLTVFRVEGILCREWKENSHLLLKSWSENLCSDRESLSNGSRSRALHKGPLSLRVRIRVLSHQASGLPQTGPTADSSLPCFFCSASSLWPVLGSHHRDLCTHPVWGMGINFDSGLVTSSRHFQSVSAD